jgi:hypothetical protein
MRKRWGMIVMVAAVGLTGCGEDGPSPVLLPEQPVVSVNGDVKQLVFTWGAATDVDSYSLFESADGSSAGLEQVGDSVSGSETRLTRDVVVHELDWENARYVVRACNDGGCTDSASLAVDDLSLSAVGYFKNSNTKRYDRLGEAVALSEDGSTLAVAAVGRRNYSGSVFVFRRESGLWQQEAELHGTWTEPGDRFGTSIALSATGDTLVVGAPLEDSAATTVDGSERSNARSNSGAVYVFTRETGGWVQTAFLKTLNADVGDNFGGAVAVNGDGTMVVGGAAYEDSSAIKVNGNQAANDAQEAGAAYVFLKSRNTWVQLAYLKASNTDAEDWFGHSVAISHDGDTVLVGAPLEDGSSTGVGGDLSSNALTKAGAAYVFRRAGQTYGNPVYLKASNSGLKDWFGWTVAIAGDGNTLAVAAPEEDAVGGGIDGNQSTNGNPNSGAVYAFGFRDAHWRQQAFIKAASPTTEDEFGMALALSEDGDRLAVGSSGESSRAVGINGQQANEGALLSGAAYVFARSGITWRQLAYVKASNTGTKDRFGDSVALSADGQALAVGAPLEDSGAAGIDGDQTDNSATDSGAAYLY